MIDARKKELLIIMPAYNEEESIGNVCEALKNSGITQYADVLIINDASSDHTNEILKSYHHTVITHVFNLGYGSALQLGYKYAVRRDYEYVIQMDADGQHDVSNVPLIYRALKEKDETGYIPDIVLGSRYVEGAFGYHASFPKRMAYAFFRKLIKTATQKYIADPTTGLQGLNRKALLYCAQYNQFETNYPDANVIIQMSLLGFHIKEIPAVMHMREGGVSMHSGLEPFFYMVRMTLSILAVIYRIKVLKWRAGNIEDKYERS